MKTTTGALGNVVEGKATRGYGLQSVQQFPPSTTTQKIRILLVINSRTNPAEVQEALAQAKNHDASLTVIYTAVPLFLSDQTTSAEVDYDFADKLDKGRSVLDTIKYQANQLGVEISTSFVWSESPTEIPQEYSNTVEFVLYKVE